MIKFIAMLALPLVAGAAQAALQDGTYEAQVTGHNAPFAVRATVAAGVLTQVEASANLETLGVGKRAIDSLSGRIVAGQSIGLDALTGATVSSRALLEGVRNCLVQAGATGAEIERWTRNIEEHPTQPLELEADVVIAGGGGAGLAAAVSALESGSGHVVIVEKLGFLGGSTQVSGGAFNAVDDKRQKAQGIDDSPEKFFESTLRGGHFKGDPRLVHHLTYNAFDTLQWLEAMGVRFRDRVTSATGSLGQRTHVTEPPGGRAYTSVLEKRLAGFGDRVTILTDCPAGELIVQNGTVTGLKALRHGRQPVTVRARAVVVATGGFGANVALRQRVNTGVWKDAVLDERIGTTNIHGAAQGDGLRLAAQAGAGFVGLEDIQLHHNGTPGTGLMQDISTFGRNRIFVNIEGRRFVSESSSRDALCRAVFAQPEGSYWVVMNHLRWPDENRTNAAGVSMRDMLRLGRVKKGDTLEDLARAIGVPAANLKASVEEYNRVVRNKGTADRFGFTADNTDDAPLTGGPWYACKKVPSVHHTMGGVRIDTHARVLDGRGEPIRGLYAAGEVTGGIHGANRLGGNAIADAFTFGREAGRRAAAHR